MRSVLYLHIGAQVTLLKNYIAEIGLHNGAVGRLVQVVYNENNIPVVLIICFPNYYGPSVLPDIPQCVALYPDIVRFTHKGNKYTRRNFFISPEL